LKVIKNGEKQNTWCGKHHEIIDGTGFKLFCGGDGVTALLQGICGRDFVPVCLDIAVSEGPGDSADSWQEALRLLALYLKSEGISEDAAVEALLRWSHGSTDLYALDDAIAKDAIKKAYSSRKTWSCREYQSSILGKDSWLECDRDACLWFDDHQAEANRKSQTESLSGLDAGKRQPRGELRDEAGRDRSEIGEDGTVQAVVYDKKGGKHIEWISDCAIQIDTETTAKGVSEFTFRGFGAQDHKLIEFTMKASDAQDDRKFRAQVGAVCGSKNRVGKLTIETVKEITQSTRIMLRAETPAWEGNIPTVPGVNLDNNIVCCLSPAIPAAVYDGDLKAAQETLRKLLRVHRLAPILVATVLGSPAIARWYKNDRFGLGIWGITGSLKTSTALAAMGIYGLGYLDGPKLKAGKAGSTLVALGEVFAAAGFLPQVYDDVKTVDSKDTATYVAAIHAVLEGEEKLRGKKDGGLREARAYLCTPIITGEVRPSEASTSARVLNLDWTRPDDRLLSEVQKNARHLPVIGYYWLRYLATIEDGRNKDFEEFRLVMSDEFRSRRYENSGRLATIYTLLRCVWLLLEATPFGEVFKELHNEFKAALDDAIVSQGEAVSEETEVERLLSGITELIAANPGLIMSLDGQKTIIGSIIGKRMEEGIFFLPAETLNALTNKRVFTQQPSIDSMTKALGEKGALIPDTDGKHLKYRMRLNGSNPRGWYIKREFISTAWGDGDDHVPTHQPPRGNTLGNAKIDSRSMNVPTVPTVPTKMREILEKNPPMKNHEESTNSSIRGESGGNSGNSGNNSIVNKSIDVDFDSNKCVPTSVPTDSNGGYTPSSHVDGDNKVAPTLEGMEGATGNPSPDPREKTVSSEDLSHLSQSCPSLGHHQTTTHHTTPPTTCPTCPIKERDGKNTEKGGVDDKGLLPRLPGFFGTGGTGPVPTEPAHIEKAPVPGRASTGPGGTGVNAQTPDGVDVQDEARHDHFKKKASEVAGPGLPAGEPEQAPPGEEAPGQEAHPDSGPHEPVEKVEPIPRPHCYLAKVRGAAIIEYGYSGWVDPAKVAKAAGILECQACRALLHLGYEQFERQGGGIGFRQSVTLPEGATA